MRELEVVDHNTRDALGNHIRIKVYELCLPDDFHSDAPPLLDFAWDMSTFSVSDNIHRDLVALRTAQAANASLEYGLVRVQTPEGYLMVNHILVGTEHGIGHRIFPKKLYETGSMLVSESQPKEVTDDYHTHTLVPGVDPGVSNLFSADDFLSMAYMKNRRFWMTGIDGGVLVLINPNKPEYLDEFTKPAYQYGNRFHAGYSYQEAFQDMMDCVESCGLLIFRSTDNRHFSLVTRDAPPSVQVRRKSN